MARAHEHLASARYAEAAGAFRAVLRIDPNEFQAHFGLADALVARGQVGEAVEGLVAAAESCSAREDHGAALSLYGKALAVDPMRLELHLDVAMAEAGLGRMEAAQSRLEHLAEVYMQAGRTDEAAEVYRCLAGWEGDGEEVEEVEPEVVAPPRVTQVPTGAPGQPPRPRDAVPMTIPSSETVVIPTILITPDGQLLQVPVEQQSEAWAPASGGDTMPRIPAELVEVAHSAPLDLPVAGGEEAVGVERTVVGFPPPPPSLPEEYESAAHGIDRSELEAAVVAAMDNLAQLEEEDMTLVMQRLPPNSKLAGLRRASGESRLPEFVTRSRLPKPELPPPEAVVETPAPESKLRIRPAPRPTAKTPPPVPPRGGAPSAARVGAAEAGASKPASTPTRAGSTVAASKPSPVAPRSAPRPSPAGNEPRGASRPSPARREPTVAPRPSPAAPRGASSLPTGASGSARPAAAPAARPGPAQAPAGEAAPSKPTRPNNPLAERLRRRAGLQKPEAAPGRSVDPRATEPIVVRSPSTLPPGKPPTKK